MNAFTARIKDAHDRHCTNWETWQVTERDIFGKTFTATVEGCRTCGVKVFPEPEAAAV